jgi:hypothetical protein
MSTPMVDRPVFIVGSGRSGTTLLRSVLSAHSRIAIAPETHFLKRVERSGRNGSTTFDRLVSDYVATIRFADIGTTKERWLELIDGQGERSARTAFTALLLAYQERTGKPRIGEKTPGHLHHLQRLLSWFPDARVIILRRDPRAVLGSKVHAPWVVERLNRPSFRSGVVAGTRFEFLAREARAWRHAYGTVVPAWQADPRICVIDYEALVRDAEPAIRQICSFLGERFEPSMLADRRTPAPEVDDGEGLAHGELADARAAHLARSQAPISPGSLERWRERLTPLEVAMVEATCGDVAATIGHDMGTPPWMRLATAWMSGTVLATGKVERAARRMVRGRG